MIFNVQLLFLRAKFHQNDGLTTTNLLKYAMRFLQTTTVTLIFVSVTYGAELNWPQFRGPRGDGTSLAKQVPVNWGETNNIIWKMPIPGRGRSSPVVMGDRIWLTTALEEGVHRIPIGGDDMQTAEHISLEVLCLNAANGKTIWRTRLFDVDKPDPVHWFNSWATPTPVVEAGRIYCDFGTFGTACVESKTGEILWKTRLPSDHQVGPGSSPVLYKNLLVLVRDGREAQYVTALDKKTGAAAWKTDRPPIDTSSPNLKKSFVTPLVVTTGKQTQLISPTAHWIVAYEPSTGKELWRVRHGVGFSIGSCPVFGHGMVFFSTGCMKAQLWAIRADGEGDVTGTHVAWKTTRQVPVMSSPVMIGDEIYWVSDDGMANCADALTGEVHWQERLGGHHLASPLLAENRVYFFGKDGKCTVVKASKQFEKLSENLLQADAVATPAIVDRSLYFRTDNHLYRIGNK